jgi:hypothetical protein
MVEIPKIKGSDRVAVIGSSGSGKTFLSKRMLPYDGKRIIVVDPKRTFKPAPNQVMPVIKDIAHISRQTFFVFQPKLTQYDDMEVYDRLLKHAYNVGNITLYIDDLAGICDSPSSYPKAMKLCYNLGRERNVNIISCLQRPMHVPGYIWANTEHYFIFNVPLESDRKKLLGIIPAYDPMKIHKAPKYSFGYYHRDTPELAQLRKIKK